MVGGVQGGRQAAVPPLLQGWTQTHREQRDHRRTGARSGLQELHGIGRTATGRQIGHEAATDASPAGFLAAPGKPAAGPGQLLPIKQSAAGPQHPEAVLPAGTGMLAPGFQQLPVRSGKQACRGNTTGARRHGRGCGNAMKKPPRRVAEPKAGNKPGGAWRTIRELGLRLGSPDRVAAGPRMWADGTPREKGSPDLRSDSEAGDLAVGTQTANPRLDTAAASGLDVRSWQRRDRTQ